MADKLVNLRARRQRAWDACNALMDNISSLNRAMTPAENSDYDAKMAELADCDNQIQKIESLQSKIVAEFQRTTPVNPVNDEDAGPLAVREQLYAKPEYRRAVRQALLGRTQAIAKIYQDLNVGTPADGGYAVPTEWFKGLQQKRYQSNVMRQLSNVITSPNDLNITVESGLGSAAWTAEKGTFHNSDDSDSDTLGRVTLSAYKLTVMDKISKELLADSSPVFNVESWVSERFGTKLGRAEETAFISGDGSGKPTGVLAGISHGITFASEFGPTADEILNMYHSLAPAYRNVDTAWIFHDQTVLLLRKLNTGSTFKQYLWQPGLQAGQPDTLLGRPVNISLAMPQFGTPGNKVAAFGDFKSAYWIVDRERPTFQRLIELYAVSGQIGILCEERTDGKTVLAEAAVYASCGTGC